MIRRRLFVLIAVFGIVAAGCATSGDATVPTDPGIELDALASQELPTASILGAHVGDIVLPDATNGDADFALQAWSEGVLLVYFGFTFCPDVCPTTLADVRTALGLMGDDATAVDLAMITVDPERDTSEILTAYVSHFVESARALRTDDADLLDSVGDAFGAEFSVIKTEDDRTEVLHTAYLYAVDDAGSIVATWPFGAEPEVIAEGLTTLLDS